MIVWITARVHLKGKEKAQNGTPGVELRFSRHSPDWRVTQNIYSPNQRKTHQNHVFAEH
jgi:hypothetical protein